MLKNDKYDAATYVLLVLLISFLVCVSVVATPTKNSYLVLLNEDTDHENFLPTPPHFTQ